MFCMKTCVEYTFLSVTLSPSVAVYTPVGSLLTTFQPFFFSLPCFLASSGKMYELHADGDPDGEAPRWLQGTGAVLLSGRTQVLHPLEALTQE